MGWLAVAIIAVFGFGILVGYSVASIVMAPRIANLKAELARRTDDRRQQIYDYLASRQGR